MYVVTRHALIIFLFENRCNTNRHSAVRLVRNAAHDVPKYKPGVLLAFLADRKTHSAEVSLTSATISALGRVNECNLGRIV